MTDAEWNRFWKWHRKVMAGFFVLFSVGASVELALLIGKLS